MKIKKKKIIPLDRYIHKALYDNNFGYYMKSYPFGKNGDYITAPNISILFSEMIAIWIISFWKKLNCPKEFNLIELGAGNGEMILQILKTFKKFSFFKDCCKINILEKSTNLMNIQKKKLAKENIKWLKDLNQISNIPNIFIANEFFDALPIKQFIKKKHQWYERNVSFKSNKEITFIDIKVDIKEIEKKVGFKISFKQDFIEYSPLSIEYLKIISKKINDNNGGILIIDYGYLHYKMNNSLKSISKHSFTNVLENFGNADITHDISFKLISKICKLFKLSNIKTTTQKEFLMRLGILERAEIITKNMLFSKKTDIFYRLKKLIHKNFMGESFKVMFITKKENKFKIGF